MSEEKEERAKTIMSEEHWKVYREGLKLLRDGNLPAVIRYLRAEYRSLPTETA